MWWEDCGNQIEIASICTSIKLKTRDSGDETSRVQLEGEAASEISRKHESLHPKSIYYPAKFQNSKIPNSKFQFVSATTILMPSLCCCLSDNGLCRVGASVAGNLAAIHSNLISSFFPHSHCRLNNNCLHLKVLYVSLPIVVEISGLTSAPLTHPIW